MRKKKKLSGIRHAGKQDQKHPNGCEPLTDAEVGVDTGIACCAREVLVLSVGNVEVGLRVAVFFSKAKVDNVDLVTSLADAHQKVVWFDVAVDERLGVNVLDAGNKLIGQQEDRLEREFAVAKVEQVFEAGSEQVKDHGIVVTLGSEPANKWNPDAAGERLVNARLIFELRMLGLNTLELDSNLLARNDIGAKVNVAKRSRSDLATDSVLVSDTKILNSRH